MLFYISAYHHLSCIVNIYFHIIYTAIQQVYFKIKTMTKYLKMTVDINGLYYSLTGVQSTNMKHFGTWVNEQRARGGSRAVATSKMEGFNS